MISDSERTQINGSGSGGATRNGGAPSMARNRIIDGPPFPSIRNIKRTDNRNPISRSPSLEPSREITRPIRSDIRGGRSPSTSQLTPATATTAHTSSRRTSRPTKRIGCLGSSSNMTRHRSRDASRGVDRENRRGKTSDEMNNLGRSTLKGLSHQPLALEGPEWQQHACQQHVGETQHRSPPSETARLKSTDYSNDTPFPRSVINSRPVCGGVNNSSRRSISRHRLHHRKNNPISRDATPADTGISSLLSSRMEKQIHVQDSMRYHHHRHDFNSVKGSAKLPAKLIKSASSSTGKTVESINTKETEALSDSTVFCRFDSVTDRASKIPPAIQKELDDAAEYIAYLSSRALPSTDHIVNDARNHKDALSSGMHYRRATVMDHPNNAVTTYGCNEKGCCLRHPHVQLRKKKLMGGWNNLMSNCPECCVEEMRRLKRLQARISESKSKAFNCHETRGRRHAYDHEYQKQVNHPPLKLGSSTARNLNTSCRRSRSFSNGGDVNGRGSRRDRSHINSKHDKSQKFEFDIALDAHGNITCPRSVMRSSQSPIMKKYCASVKSNKSARSMRSRNCKSTFTMSKTSMSVSDLISRCMHTRS